MDANTEALLVALLLEALQLLLSVIKKIIEHVATLQTEIVRG